MMGLRLSEGVPLARIEADAGRPWDAILDRAAVDRLCSAGFPDARRRSAGRDGRRPPRAWTP